MCTKDIKFQFIKTIFRQIDGAAFWSQLGPNMADDFMGYRESTMLRQAITETTGYSRYTDDTFIVFNSKEHAIDMLELLNNAHPNLKFIMKH